MDEFSKLFVRLRKAIDFYVGAHELGLSKEKRFSELEKCRKNFNSLPEQQQRILVYVIMEQIERLE